MAMTRIDVTLHAALHTEAIAFRPTHKKGQFYFYDNFGNMGTDFNNSFTFGFADKVRNTVK